MIYLVRHGFHSLLDRVLCGRSYDVPLSQEGISQARALARQFSGMRIGLVQSSPRRRCRETAAAIAQVHELKVDCADEVDEFDAGEWSGRSFECLASDPAWLRWNTCRGSTRPPDGESMAELQTRVVAHIEELLADCANAVIVSHAEPIRAVLLHYRGMPLDRYCEIEIPPASISILRTSRAGVDTRITPISVPS